jgi:hypothetical protein
MAYEDILKMLANFNLVAWVIAAISCFFVQRNMRSKGWTVIMIGSVFVVVRQLWKVIVPGYGAGQASEVIFNAYMMRYVFGGIGAIIISIGFMMLITNYFVVKTMLEAD